MRLPDRCGVLVLAVGVAAAMALTCPATSIGRRANLHRPIWPTEHATFRSRNLLWQIAYGLPLPRLDALL
jgi:hypothetical protein